MLSIDQVIIKGFQSHVKSSFTLSPGLTVITGPSDAGKTAIIRALRWLAFNEPQGENFLHTIRNADGSIKSAVDQAEVTVIFNNGVSVTKTRRKGKTTYVHSLYPEPWEKAEVPPEIKEAVGLLKQTYGDFETCLNFAFQLDPPFLLSETGSVGAKVLGKLAGTEVVDRAIGAVNKQVHNTRAALAFAEKTIGQLDVELLEYLEVDQNFATLLSLEKSFQDVEAIITKHNTLADLNNSYTGLTERRIAAYDILQPLICVTKLQADVSGVERAYNRLQVLTKADADFWNAVKASQTAKATVRRLESVGAIQDRLYSLDQLYTRLQVLIRLDATYAKVENDKATSLTMKTNAEKILQQSTRFSLVVQADERLRQLKHLQNAHRIAIQGLTDIKARLDTLATVDAIQGKIGGIRGVAERLDTLTYLSDSYDGADEIVADRRKALQRAENDVQTAQKWLTDAWEAAGGMCPMCEQPLQGGVATCTH